MNRFTHNKNVSTTLAMGEVYRSAPRVLGSLAAAVAGAVTLTTLVATL